MFRFIADRSGELVLRTKALSGDLNTVLRVWDQNRTMIAVNNNWNGQLDSRTSINITAGQQYYAHVDTLRNTAGDYRLFLIPKSDRSDRGRAPVDLNLPNSVDSMAGFARGSLALGAVSEASTGWAATELSKLDRFNEQIGTIANGLG